MVKFRLPKTREPGRARFVTNAVTILKLVFVRPLVGRPELLKIFVKFEFLNFDEKFRRICPKTSLDFK